ncbi:MAG: 2,3-bisphosphoglycerate-independent phosphoglycerate mutase [Patescibacteria group bacterium]
MVTSAPILLLILDGFGISRFKEGNALAQATTPNLDLFFSYFPKTTLAHSGLAVGLPPRVVGNSEVGHKSIGSGRIVPQTLQTINDALFYDQWYQNEAFLKAASHAEKNKSSIQIIGLLSDGGGHSHIDHCLGILKLLKRKNCTRPIILHLILDGRDMPPQSAVPYIKAVRAAITNYGFTDNQVHFGSIGGRYFGMDRNSHWERIEQHFMAFTGTGTSIPESDIEKYITDSYAKNSSDEFVVPVACTGKTKKERFGITKGDSVVLFNFRPDRMRQLLHTFVDKKFPHFTRPDLSGIAITTLTDYEAGVHFPNVTVAFPEPVLDNTLAHVLSQNNLTQLHIAESEKKAHITYFLNGGTSTPETGEDTTIIPSPSVVTYDLSPGMKTPEIVTEVITHITAKKYDFYAINIAATDMVAHTGNLAAGVKAVEIVDRELGRLWEIVKKEKGMIILTSDHGNIEEMINPDTKSKDTEHNMNPVPFVMIAPQLMRQKPGEISIETMAKNPTGTLADIMPTILEVYGIPMPEMEVYADQKGISLIGRLQ